MNRVSATISPRIRQSSTVMSTENTTTDGRQATQDSLVFQGTDVHVQAMFDHLEQGLNLHVFLAQHPAVSKEQALAAINKKQREEVQAVVDSNEQYLSGTPRFAGTRVPIKNMIDYVAEGYPLDEFLRDFPGVSREDALRTIRLAGQLLESAAYENSVG